MFLLGAVILTRAGDAQAECVAIKLQARFGIAHDNRSVVDTEKQFVFLLPLLIALACGKLQNLEPVLVRIAKVESLDAARILVPIRRPLWTSRSMFDFVLAQQSVSFVHVAGDDGDVLKPMIVAARIDRNRAAFWCQVLGQLDELV